ncbi:MAG: hypothetical protein AAGU05_16030, partial [Anaerolineaceae bacterium]
MLLGEVVDELGSDNDFIGHAGGDNFVIVTSEQAGDALKQRLKTRFAEEVQTHYNFMDREQGFIQVTDKNGQVQQAPLMTLAVGLVSPSTHMFADIREITELAAEERRQDTALAG